MIDGEMLRQRDIEAGFNAGFADVCRQIGRGGDFVHRHFARLVIRTGKGLVHPDRENRQIIQEKCVEMIGVEHHDQVRTRGGELFLLSRE